jgi:hypothetical protein
MDRGEGRIVKKGTSMTASKSVAASPDNTAGKQPTRTKSKGPRLVTGERPDDLPAVKYEPTPAEARVVAEQAAKRAARGPRTHMAEDREGGVIGISDHADPAVGGELYMAALGTTDWDFGKIITAHLANLSVAPSGGVDNASFTAHQALVQGIGPQDEVEALLAVQMAAVHSATMLMAGRLRVEKSLHASESYERSLSRLTRTFTAQVEALKRHRTRGVQKVIVQHVQVNEGGQALVTGEVNGGGARNEGQPHGRDSNSASDELCFSEGQAVLGALEAVGLPLSGAGNDGVECVQVPRRQGRAASGEDE